MGEHAQQCQDDVPEARSQSRKNGKCRKLHVGDASGNGNQLADCGDEPADKCGNRAVLAEEFLGLDNLFGIEQAHGADARIGKPVDDRTTEELGEIVIDERSENGSECGEQDDEDNVQA